MNITLSLPRAVRTLCMPTSEPSASPSGFSCVTRAKRCAPRISSRTCSREEAPPFSLIGAHLPQDLLDARGALGGVVVDELQRRRALHPQLSAHPRLQDAVGGLQPRQRRLALLVRSEHADEHPRMAQVGTRLYVGDGHESDAGVLEVLKNCVAQHLAHRLVDATHARAHANSSKDATVRSIRELSGKRSRTCRSTRSTASSSVRSEPLVSAAASVARCQAS